MVFLVTCWFGSFRFSDEGILDEMILFENDVENISCKLEKIHSGALLSEEKELIKDFSSIIVNQKRLRCVGHYDPNHPFFFKYYSKLKSYGPDIKLLYKASIKQANRCIDEQLGLPDFRVIQKVHMIDDLLQTVNIFDERLIAWSLFSMGSDDVQTIQGIRNQMSDEINRLQESIKKDMVILTPNTSSLIGPLLTARLLSHAGSMEKMGRLPASSIQLLGAEKALFRYKKEGGKPPKHGVLFQHEALLKAPKKVKGKIARILSLKIILSIRADVYTKRSIGGQLKKEFDDQVKEILKGKL